MEHYAVIRQIGKGSFGTAELVEDKRNKKRYIMKKTRLARQQELQREATVQEMYIQKECGHRNIVQCHDSWMEKGFVTCLVLEHCSKGELANILSSRLKTDHFPEETILDMFVQVASALAYLHNNSIVHRDIKAANIFIRDDQSLALGDFGLAKTKVSSTELADITLGTPQYMAPEIVAGKPYYNDKTDIWALGVLFFEVTTFKPPFTAFNMPGLVEKIKKSPMPGIPPEYSTEWKAILKSCLEKDASARPTAAKLLQIPNLQDSVRRVTQRWGAAILDGKQSVTVTPVDTAAVLESCRKASVAKRPASTRPALPLPSAGPASGAKLTTATPAGAKTARKQSPAPQKLPDLQKEKKAGNSVKKPQPRPKPKHKPADQPSADPPGIAKKPRVPVMSKKPVGAAAPKTEPSKPAQPVDYRKPRVPVLSKQSKPGTEPATEGKAGPKVAPLRSNSDKMPAIPVTIKPAHVQHKQQHKQQNSGSSQQEQHLPAAAGKGLSTILAKGHPSQGSGRPSQGGEDATPPQPSTSGQEGLPAVAGAADRESEGDVTLSGETAANDHFGSPDRRQSSAVRAAAYVSAHERPRSRTVPPKAGRKEAQAKQSPRDSRAVSTPHVRPSSQKAGTVYGKPGQAYAVKATKPAKPRLHAAAVAAAEVIQTSDTEVPGQGSTARSLRSPEKGSPRRPKGTLSTMASIRGSKGDRKHGGVTTRALAAQPAPAPAPDRPSTTLRPVRGSQNYAGRAATLAAVKASDEASGIQRPLHSYKPSANGSSTSPNGKKAAKRGTPPPDHQFQLENLFGSQLMQRKGATYRYSVDDGHVSTSGRGSGPKAASRAGTAAVGFRAPRALDLSHTPGGLLIGAKTPGGHNRSGAASPHSPLQASLSPGKRNGGHKPTHLGDASNTLKAQMQKLADSYDESLGISKLHVAAGPKTSISQAKGEGSAAWETGPTTWVS